MKRQCLPAAKLAVFALVAVFGVASARAQVLQQVPVDAVVVIKVSNLRAVSDKVGKFAGQLGLVAFAPDFADPLGAMKKQLQITEGLDEAGEMAIVVTKAAFDENAGADPGVIALMPVTDYKAFSGNLKEAKADGAVTHFKGHENGNDMYAANWGKYAAISSHKELLASKPTGLKLAGLAAKEAKEKDAFIFANMPLLAEKAMPHIEKAKAEMNGEIDKEFEGKADAKQFAGVAKAAAGQAINIAERFLRDTTSAGFSLHFTDTGIQTTMMADFKPDTYGGKLAKGLKNSNEPMMAGLPERKFFMAGGMVNAPEVTGKVIADLLDPISKELAATEAGKGFASSIDALKKMAGATKSITFGYPAPTGAVGADSVLQSVFVMHGDSKTIVDSQKATLAGLVDLMKIMPKQDGAPEMSLALTEPKAVGDLKFQTYKMDMKMDEGNPQAQQVKGAMDMMYGPNGMAGIYGAVNKDTSVLIQGGNDALLQEAVSAAKNSKDALGGTAAVKRVSDKLPGQRIAVEYIFVDNVVATGLRYAETFGLPIKLQLPPDLSPIGVAAATEGNAFRVDGFIPTDLVQGLVSTGMQAFMQMQGGGGGGGAAPGNNPDGL